MNHFRLTACAFPVLLLATLGYAQEPRDDAKPPQQQEEPKPEPKREAAPPHQGEMKPPRQNEAKPPKDEKREERQEAAKPPREDAKPAQEQRNQQAAEHRERPAGKSVHIPDEKFRANFGRQHTVVIRQPVIVEGRPRFQFSGYWFDIVDVWPGDWAYTDDCYVDYIDGEYFLFNVRHPGVRIALFVTVG